MNRHYIVKIVPPWGYRVFRLRFTPQHIGFAVLCSILAFGGVAGFYVLEMRHAEARVGELRTLTDDQHARLEKIDAQAAELDNELRSIELQDDQIRKMIGAGGKTRKAGKAQPPAGGQESYLRDGAFNTVAEHIAQLRERSAHVHAESSQLRSIALHVLNMRRLEDLARARVLAAIPSLTPSGTGEIASPFGWRVDPWPEFHQGVDLVADYGEPVRAAAAGTVVSAGWDGGWGLKVDVDHGNGYHTWYCHLSKFDVAPGQWVTKAQQIAYVGTTGASTGPHLHYQIMLDGHPIDPAPYLNGVPEKVLAAIGTAGSSAAP